MGDQLGDQLNAFSEPPDPASIRSPGDVVLGLRLLRAWAGDPSYAAIARKVNAAWRAEGRPAREWSTAKNTVADCFRPRPRPNDELLIAIVAALHADPGYVSAWRQALRIIRGEIAAAAFVTAGDRLPDELADFVGRSAELRELTRKPGAGSWVATVIEGMPGVGKSALAIHAGHRMLRAGHADRVFYVDLRGFHPDPARPPVDPAAVLVELLRLLGAPASESQLSDLGRLAVAYRQRLRGHRVLVLLDNAASAEQVAPLLPADPQSPALVTSRHRLARLPRTRLMRLEPFPPDDAVRLLRSAAGEPRYRADPEATARIAELLGYLPLALAVVAGRIHSRPWPISEHLDWLTSRFTAGEPADRVTRAARLRLTGQIQLAIGLSYESLGPDERGLLRRLAWHPGPDVDPYAAAALADCEMTRAERHLARLLGANLLQQRQSGRHHLHDVIRAFALDRAYDEEPATARHAALTRLLDHFRHNAAAAMQLCAPYEKERPTQPLTAPAPSVPLNGATDAEAWLAAELPNLLACAGYAAVAGWPAHAVDVSLILYQYLHERSRFADARTLHTAALAAARATGDRSSECQVLINLGLTAFVGGDLPQALGHLGEGLVVARECNDRTGEGRALANLAETYAMLGRLDEALDHFQQALAITRETGYRVGESRILGSIGTTYGRLGQLRAAIRHLRQGALLAREIGDWDGECRCLINLGFALAKLEHHGMAIRVYQQTLTIFEALGDHNSVGYAHHFLGTAYAAMGRYREALDGHNRALEVAREVGNPLLAAAAHNGVGDANWGLDRPKLAHTHWEQALAGFAERGTPEADEVRAKLDRHRG